jgi:plastocyanin
MRMKSKFTIQRWKHLLIFVSVILFSGNMFAQTKHIIEVTKNVFTPDNLKINPGDTVEWRNTDGFHNVNGTMATYPMNPESFGNSAGTDWTYSHVFSMPGNYDYQCDPHVDLGMIGKIEVTSGATKHIVEVTKNVFTPDNLKINVGDTVEWRNSDGFHNVNGTMVTYPMNPESFGNSTGTDWTYSHVFSMPGNYDYQCDPHVALGMIGKIEVTGDDDPMKMLTINFMGMNPHIGQELWLAVIDKSSGMEVGRVKKMVKQDFMVHVPGIKPGMSYNIDFFADHNGNGMYDAPPVDHAWRMDLDNVMGDTTLNFSHNTNFTDIMWMYQLTIHFMEMNPHVGQNMWLAVIDKSSGMEVSRVKKASAQDNMLQSSGLAPGMEVGRVKTVVEQDFMVHVWGIKPGMSYNVDFFVDHNGNGMYDAPPVDHAWRMDLDNVMGDTTLNFSHNTNFTDINLSTGIEEDLGENNLSVYPNPASQKVFVSLNNVNESDFTVHIYNLAGKQLVHSKLKNTNSPVEFDISEFESGLYFMRIETLQNSDIVKFVKQ